MYRFNAYQIKLTGRCFSKDELHFRTLCEQSMVLGYSLKLGYSLRKDGQIRGTE